MIVCPKCESIHTWRAAWISKNKCNDCQFEFTDEEHLSYKGITIEKATEHGVAEMTVEACFCPENDGRPHLHLDDKTILDWEDVRQRAGKQYIERFSKRG